MRIWSIHPKYLDFKRLTAVWREALLARAVLENKTKGYKNHPQLERFKQQTNPLKFINFYLYTIFQESKKRKYKFNKLKLKKPITKKKINVTIEQLKYEIKHLSKKLDKPISLKKIQTNPLFIPVKGETENWEKIKF